jgi:hypothetical protein
MDVKVTINQKNTNITEVKESKNNLTEFKKNLLGKEIYGRAIDPFTGVEFVKTRTNQRFECPESRVLYHNKINNKLRYDIIKKRPKNILNNARMKLYGQEQKKLKLENTKQLVVVIFLWLLVFLVLFIIGKFIFNNNFNQHFL